MRIAFFKLIIFLRVLDFKGVGQSFGALFVHQHVFSNARFIESNIPVQLKYNMQLYSNKLIKLKNVS